MDYEKDMEIDESALDVEWLGQPSLAFKYGKYAAQCAAKVRLLEEQKKTIRSQLILSVNENPAKLIGKDKPNANDIEAYYRTQPKYIKAVEALNDMLEESEMAQVAKNEICYTRKAALEHLVILHGQQYFAGPSVPRDLTKEWVDRNKQKISDIETAKEFKRRRA